MQQACFPGIDHMIQVGVNALHIKWGVNAGTETYFTNIVRPWYDNENINFKFILYCHHLPPWWHGEKSFFNVKLFPMASSLPGRLFYEQILLPLGSYRKLDILFSPGYVGSIFSRKPQIITIHDAFAWKYPSEIGWLRGLYWRTAIPLSAKRAAMLITVSQSTANDVAKYCNISLSKISVVMEAGAHLESIGPDWGILDRLGLKDVSYFHCVGFFKDIKNPWCILNAYKKYMVTSQLEQCKKLVIIGLVGGEQGQKILEAARALPNIIIAGRVDDSELSAIYNKSSGLIFPSLYEGFGLPILEAQSFSCPVVTSNNSSMPEVAGEGALLVDASSSDEICKAMHILSTCDVSDMVDKGKTNMKKFSWDKASNETLDLIGKIVFKG